MYAHVHLQMQPMAKMTFKNGSPHTQAEIKYTRSNFSLVWGVSQSQETKNLGNKRMLSKIFRRQTSKQCPPALQIEGKSISA